METQIGLNSLLRSRTVAEIAPSLQTIEGEGMVVHRPFPVAVRNQVDPFLLLDRFGPIEFKPGEAKGVPTHPHRGFEIITYLLSGSMDHRDSNGNTGRLRGGDLQWMRAGSGVLHNEWPSPDFKKSGGIGHGIQLWINLPASAKMSQPEYRDIQAMEIPVWCHPFHRVEIKVIAGKVVSPNGMLVGPVTPHTDLLYLHVHLQPQGRLEIPLTPGHTALVFGMGGLAWIGEERSPLKNNELAILGEEGEGVFIGNPGTENSEIILLASAPLKEPMVRHGPFVMNTEAEIETAMRDYRQGQFGWLADPILP